MEYLKPGSEIASRETDAQVPGSKALLESQLMALEDRHRELPRDDVLPRARVRLEMARTLIRLERGSEAWEHAREAFELFVRSEQWESAVEACDALFLCDHPDSLGALGQGVWLAVTYPINPELTVAMLQHIVDETPNDSDGAAVAAATAHYVVDMRAKGKTKENLSVFTGRMLSTVARRHSDVSAQEEFDAWLKRLELDDPSKFLVRLRNVVDVLVQDQWWFDREALQSRLPVN